MYGPFSALLAIAAIVLFAVGSWQFVKRVRRWKSLDSRRRWATIFLGAVLTTFVALETIPIHQDFGPQDGFCDYIGVIPIVGVCGIP